MKIRTMDAMLAITLALISVHAWSDSWSRGMTVKSVGTMENAGELVVFTVDGEAPTPTRCHIATEYAIRNKETVRSALALLMSSLVAQRTVDILVTGSCDSSGRPLVEGVILR